LSENNFDSKQEVIKNILLFFISNSKYLTEKRLQKLFYIAEIEYIHRFGERFSNVNFINHKHGMYSFDIKYLLDTLEDDGKISPVFKKTKDGYDAQFFHSKKKEIVIELNDKRIGLLNEIIKKFTFLITQEIIKFAKDTKPFKTTPYGKRIDLEGYVEECYNNSLSKDKKLVKDIIDSEVDYKEGNFTKFNSCSDLLKHFDGL